MQKHVYSRLRKAINAHAPNVGCGGASVVLHIKLYRHLLAWHKILFACLRYRVDDDIFFNAVRVARVSFYMGRDTHKRVAEVLL